jgi:hypothetical protein
VDSPIDRVEGRVLRGFYNRRREGGSRARESFAVTQFPEQR